MESPSRLWVCTSFPPGSRRAGQGPRARTAGRAGSARCCTGVPSPFTQKRPWWCFLVRTERFHNLSLGPLFKWSSGWPWTGGQGGLGPSGWCWSGALSAGAGVGKTVVNKMESHYPRPSGMLWGKWWAVPVSGCWTLRSEERVLWPPLCSAPEWPRPRVTGFLPQNAGEEEPKTWYPAQGLSETTGCWGARAEVASSGDPDVHIPLPWMPCPRSRPSHGHGRA